MCASVRLSEKGGSAWRLLAAREGGWQTDGARQGGNPSRCAQDMETLDLEDFSYNNVNMTAFRMVDADDAGVKEALRQMERFAPIGHHIINSSGVIQVLPLIVSSKSQIPLRILSCMSRNLRGFAEIILLRYKAQI